MDGTCIDGCMAGYKPENRHCNQSKDINNVDIGNFLTNNNDIKLAFVSINVQQQ